MKLVGKAIFNIFKGAFFMLLLVGFLAMAAKGLYEERGGNIPNDDEVLV